MSDGHVAMGKGALVEAADRFGQAKALYRDEDDFAGARLATILEATALLELGLLEQATTVVEPVGPDAEAHQDREALLASLILLADIALSGRNFERCLSITNVLLEQMEQGTGTDHHWRTRLLRSEACIGTRDESGFWTELESMHRLESEPTSKSVAAHRQAVMALGSILTGELGVGTTDGVDSIIRLANSGRPSVACRLVACYATFFGEAGEITVALQFLDHSATLAFTCGNRMQGLYALHQMSRLLVQADRPAEAIEVLERAISEAHGAGDAEEVEKAMLEALSIERAMNYPRLVVHRMLRLAELGELRDGLASRQRWLLEALMVGVHGHVSGVREIAEAVVTRLNDDMLDSMTDNELLGFAALLGPAEHFDVAQRIVSTRAEHHVARGRTRRGAELSVQLADLACAAERFDVAESSLTMAIVLGERLGILDTELWKERLEAILYR